MSCKNATAPINIDNNPIGNCELKCKYSYKYKDSSSKLTNRGDFLSLTYEVTYPEPVTYNANAYHADEIRIYTPSLHKFSNKNAAGEIIIKHYGPNGRLLVCVPLIVDPRMNKSLDTIISNAQKYAQKQGGSTMLNSININDFIPNKKFYTYSGTLPYDQCDGTYSYIVFNPNDGAFVPISSGQLDILNKLISSNKITTVTGSGFYVNNKGPTVPLATDDIYIDCKPISDDGEIIGDNETVKSSRIAFKGIEMDKIIDSIIFKIIVGLILFSILVKSMKLLLKFIRVRSLIKSSSAN